MRRILTAALALWTAVPMTRASAQTSYTLEECPSCAEWNAPAEPRRLFGNTYYVGTRGLSALLLTSDAGHVLVDAGLPESAPLIASSVRRLGFRVEDIRLIVNSHAHYDHGGGVAELQRVSRARVAATTWSAAVLASGKSRAGDPQLGIALDYPAVSAVRIERIGDGDTLVVGQLRLVARVTAGHTPGGTTWTWQSCERDRCLDFVYADSQTPVSADGFSYSRSTEYPDALRDFENGFARLESLSCDVLVTPHPGATQLWQRLDRGDLQDREACRRYAANARVLLQRRIDSERAPR
jgi:metallo-beta-lactamase class B